MSSLLPLRYRIQNYHWGSKSFLASLRAGVPRTSVEPEAELWLGTHAAAESQVEVGGELVPLGTLLAGDPQRWLGATTSRFGSELPFLLKLLAVEEPLSLQAHPSREAALRGSEREASLGLAAAERNYRDSHHKPELVVALEPFWALRGLCPAAQVREHFGAIGSRELLQCVDEWSLAADACSFLSALLSMPNGVWRGCLRRLRVFLGAAGPRDRDDVWHWVARLVELYPDDPACLAPLFLHLVRLEPGEALFQGPGMLHCYLQGAAVEVMASSDNVLRAGLTSKKVDVPELLAISDTAVSAVERVLGREQAPGVTVWTTPAEEFELVRLRAEQARPCRWSAGGTVSLCIATRGAGVVTSSASGDSLQVAAGAALLAAPDVESLVVEGDLDLYCAAAPAVVN
jgi:mannose-6-phosphate isomerase